MFGGARRFPRHARIQTRSKLINAPLSQWKIREVDYTRNNVTSVGKFYAWIDTANSDGKCIQQCRFGQFNAASALNSSQHKLMSRGDMNLCPLVVRGVDEALCTCRNPIKFTAAVRSSVASCVCATTASFTEEETASTSRVPEYNSRFIQLSAPMSPR